MGEGSPDVSVIVPTYNRLHALPASLASLLTAQEIDLEVIVVDDGSTDDTPRVLAAYADRIRVIRQANQGAGAARNAGIAAARGEYVAFLDSDDLWHPRKLELQLARFASDPDLGLVHPPVRTFPPEPIRYVGGRLVREAVRRMEAAEDAGKTPGRLATWAAGFAPAAFARAGGRDRR